MPDMQYRIQVEGWFGWENLAYSHNIYRAMRVAEALTMCGMYRVVRVIDTDTDAVDYEWTEA